MERRIALVSSSFDPYVGGVEEHVRHVARTMRARGHHVAVWTVDRGDHLGSREVDGIEVRDLPAPLPARSGTALVHFGVEVPTAIHAWSRAYRSLRPDLLHVQCFGPNGVYALALSGLTRTPLVVSSHGETFMDDHHVFERSALLRRALRQAGHSAAVTTACSRMVAEDLVNRYGAREPVVVPNGVELGPGIEDTPTRAPDWWPTHGAVVGAVGRMQEVKGFDLLLRAFAAVRHPGERLVIAGDGPARPGLEGLAAKLDVAGAVIIPGRISRPEVAWLMAQATTVVVPSRVEAFGIVALEAWRGGAPLVLTDHSGAKDLVTDDVDALLVDPTDTVALGSAIRRMLDDPSLRARLSERGRQAVQAHSWDRVADAYLDVYDEVLGAHSGQRRRGT